MPIIFELFVYALLGFCEHEFPENMRPEKAGKIMYTAPRIHGKITNYIRY